MTKLIIPDHFLNEIISHCREVYPYEACGILAGQSGAVEKVYKMKNTEKSSVSFMMDPKEQFVVMKEMRNMGLEMTAIYHSHPVSTAYPSMKDTNLAFYPDAIYVIVSLVDEEPVLKAFEIREGKVKEVDIVSP